MTPKYVESTSLHLQFIFSLINVFPYMTTFNCIAKFGRLEGAGIGSMPYIALHPV